jgi:hypothetical protein
MVLLKGHFVPQGINLWSKLKVFLHRCIQVPFFVFKLELKRAHRSRKWKQLLLEGHFKLVFLVFKILYNLVFLIPEFINLVDKGMLSLEDKL